jgi:hypothetical protein
MRAMMHGKQASPPQEFGCHLRIEAQTEWTAPDVAHDTPAKLIIFSLDAE